MGEMLSVYDTSHVSVTLSPKVGSTLFMRQSGSVSTHTRHIMHCFVHLIGLSIRIGAVTENRRVEPRADPKGSLAVQSIVL